MASESHSHSNDDNDDDETQTRHGASSSEMDPSELPFLVTHWLANYNKNDPDHDSSDALIRIRRAASEIASAFSELGVYGTASHNNASFSDVARRWPALPRNHLENVVWSSASNTTALQSAAHERLPPSSMLEAALDRNVKSSTRGSSNSSGGQRLGSAHDNNHNEEQDLVPPQAVSALHLPTVLVPPSDSEPLEAIQTTATTTTTTLSMRINSDFQNTSRQACQATRRLLSLRQAQTEHQLELIQVHQSLEKQREMERLLQQEKSNLSELSLSIPTRIASAAFAKDLEAKHMDLRTRTTTCERVTAQLQHKQAELNQSLARSGSDQSHALRQAQARFRAAVLAQCQQRDPFVVQPPNNNNNYHHYVSLRQYGGGNRRFGKRPLGHKNVMPCPTLSHAVTMNAHLSYPVYCQCFDRTGRFFVTGADDYLVKLFYLGGPLGSRRPGLEPLDHESRRVRRSFDQNARAAVLVSTLRGHAGVICDIHVSMDNALLATASEDGDCRIWGLRDGCPVAILRGHTGGANMVSWSTLTPYRLTTVACDGLARIWDVRDAALKRYGAMIGKRVDYTLPLGGKKGQQHDAPCQTTRNNVDHANADPVVLPPLPQRDNNSNNSSFVHLDGIREPGSAVAIPPLVPAPVPPLPGDALVLGNEHPAGNAPRELQNEIQEGSFVAGSAIDEGVRLIAKLQHGEVLQDNHHPSTRSRRKAVRVVCISRCPLGGHFVTGSDDGLGRIWADMDDECVETVDKKFSLHSSFEPSKNERREQEPTHVRPLRARGGDAANAGNLLATLAGHVNAITDLSYSHAGDRILTASQKDGVLRIWSWGRDAGVDDRGLSFGSGPSGSKVFSDLRQILIRLTHPSQGGSTASTRRRGGGSSGSSVSNVYCDVAVWTPDDSKIITSQGSPSKPGTSNIVPGSQLLLIWDSQSGRCLMGIADAHSETCNVLVCHPTDSSILCSAGADGCVKLWDLDAGDCILTHHNSVDHGPVEPASNRGKKSGYLDGSFSPDGLKLVLTDDSGRITVLDALDRDASILSNSRLKSANDRNFAIAAWTKEQYFANDYYELYYDTNGYCIEKGSQLPPHLAPRAARCSHSGSPYPDMICRAFSKLMGPIPLPEQECRWERELTRLKARRGRRDCVVPLVDTAKETRAIIVAEFDPDRTVLLNSSGKTYPQIPETCDVPTELPAVRQRTNTSTRQLSNNYQWRDYDDILREEDGRNDEDPEDEEFDPASRQTAAQIGASDDSSLDGFEDEASGEYPPSSSRRTSARSRRVDRRHRDREQSLDYERHALSQPTRVSARQLVRDTPRGPYHEPDSDEDIDEFLSTNNTPSGPHVEDYSVAGHFFRMPDPGFVRRRWLRRKESKSSYSGTKKYAPQVGDSVVYIPRAHYETIKSFPSLKAPWKRWPRNSAWPVVRCRVRDIRYRFPFESYYKNQGGTQCMSVVAILTLDVTGIPEISQDRSFPWPKPHFVSRSTNTPNLTFEVSLFEECDADFVIPEQLYRWRIETLENASRARGGAVEGLPVVAYFQPEECEAEDPTASSHPGQLVNIVNEESSTSDDILGSGFDTLEIQWPDSDSSLVSPWDMVVEATAKDCPPPPRMNESQKRAVRDLLRTLERRQEVKDWFLHPVDVVRYSDYLNRIEVPMDFSFIRARLDSEYYSNTMSFLSDVQLVRDNCIKYNGAASEVSQSAMEMYKEVECAIKEVEVGENGATDESSGGSHQVNVTDRRSSLSSRVAHAVDRASSLERLPPPPVSVSQHSSRVGPARERRRSTRSSQAADRGGLFGLAGRITRSGRVSQQGVVEDETSHSGDRSLAECSSDEDQMSVEEADQESDGGSYRDAHSSSSSEDRASAKVSSETAQRGRRSRLRQPAEPVTVRSSPRRRARKSLSYTDLASDCDEDSESSSGGEEVSSDDGSENSGGEESDSAGLRSHSRALRSSRRSTSHAPVKRKAERAVRTNTAKKRKAPAVNRSKPQPSDTQQLELKRWPEIELKDITPVASAVIQRMTEADEDGIFAAPVAEAYPDIAVGYLESVENPMDYRTIQEDRIPVYQSIAELQTDLLLVFDNCIAFNKPRSHLAMYASAMKDMINDTFRDVCKELDVLLPRRW